MALSFIRVFFVVASTVISYQLGVSFAGPGASSWPLIGLAFGFSVSLLIVWIELSMKNISLRGLSAGIFGFLTGLLMVRLITDSFIFESMRYSNTALAFTVRVFSTLIFCYLGVMLAIRGKDEFSLIIPYVKFTRQDRRDDITVVDTSVIIDGRVIDICQSSFMGGCFIVPRFVLKELQQMADSSDPIKRSRGRRGLDILNRMQKSANMDIKIHEEDFPEVQETDAKLVKIAKILNARIFTSDYNLNKVAEIQHVQVLNINDLSNALKPVMLPGEETDIKIVKEGKEHNQGIGYLEDGTMIVVEGGRQLIGQRRRICVTSVLQTSAGRMIFAKALNHQDGKDK
ncbi:MAG: PIN domain nuclease [Candidatus Omnitrophica bacterium]|nr:PIN domain nuclease [Candidatus Omnitrophota bacterium]